MKLKRAKSTNEIFVTYSTSATNNCEQIVFGIKGFLEILTSMHLQNACVRSVMYNASFVKYLRTEEVARRTDVIYAARCVVDRLERDENFGE